MKIGNKVKIINKISLQYGYEGKIIKKDLTSGAWLVKFAPEHEYYFWQSELRTLEDKY